MEPIRIGSSMTLFHSSGILVENFYTYPKQSLKFSSYLLLSVNRELDDLVLQIQQPSLLR